MKIGLQITKNEKKYDRLLSLIKSDFSQDVNFIHIPDEDSLKRLYGEATNAGLVTYLVKDAGHTEIPPGTLTVVGILGPRRSVDILVGDLSLL